MDESNLQRQILHDTSWIGKPKLESAKARLNALNPHVAVETHATALDSDNALQILKDYDVVVDGTDNFETRYLTNDACYLLKKPNVYGSIFRFEGQASVFWPDRGPCYRCLYPEPPPPGLVPSCAEGGVLGILPGVVGDDPGDRGAQDPARDRRAARRPAAALRRARDELRRAQAAPRPEVPAVRRAPDDPELQDYVAFCGIGRGEEAEAVEEIAAAELKRRLDAGEALEVIDVRDPHEWEICRIPGTRLVPLGSLSEHLHEFDSSKTYVDALQVGRALGQGDRPAPARRLQAAAEPQGRHPGLVAGSGPDRPDVLGSSFEGPDRPRRRRPPAKS